MLEEEKKEIMRQFFREIGHKSVESRRLKYGVEGFNHFLKTIAKLPRNRKSKSKV